MEVLLNGIDEPGLETYLGLHRQFGDGMNKNLLTMVSGTGQRRK